ncbi:Rrf2 family transcriptional regulator, partial [Desulfovibrio desulfuricans]
MVKSVRGIAGGHMQARTPDEITLADIIIADEGGLALPGVSNVAPRGKTALDAWDMVARSMNSSLEAVSLSSVRQSSASAPRQATRSRVAQPSSPLLPE